MNTRNIIAFLLTLAAVFGSVASAQADTRLTTGDKTTFAAPNETAKTYTSPVWNRVDRKRRLQMLTDNGHGNVVQVVKTHVDGLGDTWAQIRFAGPRAPLTRWVKRSSLSQFETTTKKIIINRASHALTVYEDGLKVYSTTNIGVGKSSTPTPRGSFWIKELFTSNAPYGSVAFGTSARPKGGHIPGLGNTVGIHGMAGLGGATGAVSNGCIRVNDISKLGQYISLGVPVIVR